MRSHLIWRWEIWWWSSTQSDHSVAVELNVIFLRWWWRFKSHVSLCETEKKMREGEGDWGREEWGRGSVEWKIWEMREERESVRYLRDREFFYFININGQLVGQVGNPSDKIWKIQYPSENLKNNKILIHIRPNMARERTDERSVRVVLSDRSGLTVFCPPLVAISNQSTVRVWLRANNIFKLEKVHNYFSINLFYEFGYIKIMSKY